MPGRFAHRWNAVPARAIVRVATAFAFVLTLLLPLRAGATIVPVCEHDAMTVAPVVLETPCDTNAADNEIADGNAAPICDPRGASAIAPLRLMPIPDARIEAAPACDTMELSPSVGPSQGDHPTLINAALPHHAVLTADVLVRPASQTALVAPPEPEGGPRAGVAQDIYHPPR